MNCKRIGFFPALLPLILLQACVTAPAPSPQLGGARPLLSVPTHEAPELSSLTEGDSVIFHKGILSSMGQVTIGREYTAASGRRCKQIISAAGDELVSIACKAQNDDWYMRKLP